MNLITITSDWGTNDHYSATVKANIYRHSPDAKILDITHHIPAFDIGKAAYFIRNVYPHSPDGTVHIIGVDTIPDKNRSHLIMCYRNQFFVGTDNGIFSLLIPRGEKPSAVYKIIEMQNHDNRTFPSRDLFAKIATRLASGTPPEKFGEPSQILNRITPSLPIERKAKIPGTEIFYPEIAGRVTHIDSYGNVNTNIHQSKFNRLKSQASHFRIFYGGNDFIDRISMDYSDVGIAKELALFASDGCLQIAMNRANAAGLLGIKKDSAIIIRFRN
ncbi:MAG: SAM-dependent chlorinase/fluorinase [Lentimicrobiaceae bacterium]|nr:SAM-dependent chlorinase/fluorinase [Lentimicrobiaceae bacterium]